MSLPTTPRSSGQSQEVPKHSRTASFCTQSMTSCCEEEDREKSTKKFFSNWKQACDKTKDRTKELLKRTLSWKDPQMEVEDDRTTGDSAETVIGLAKQSRGWSVHVWTTWVKRSSLDENESSESIPINLTTVQKQKFEHFFHHLLDLDRDDVICADDVYNLSEKLRHFADWSETSVDFSMLQQIQEGLIREFISNDRMYIDLEHWLQQWSKLLESARHFSDLPFWLQQMPRILFSIINKTGLGIILKDELKIFFISVVGIESLSEDDLATAYNSLTANEDYKLNFNVYRLCFANWLFGHNPNGPGQWIFGKCGSLPESFPIDYSALNTAPEDNELYCVGKKSDRFSIIV